MPGWLRLTGRFQMSEQDAEKVRQRRSCIVQGPQRTPEGTPPALHSLRPCWTVFLSILREVLPLSQICRPVKFRRAIECFRGLLEINSSLSRVDSSPLSPVQ